MTLKKLYRLLQMIVPFTFPWAIAAVVMSVVSAGIAIMQGHQQKAIADANARNLQIQAQRERQAADRQAQIAAQRRKRERAKASVGYAASGVLIDEGSPLIVEAEDDYQSELNEATIRAQGADTAWKAQSQAGIERAKGRAAVTAGYGRAAGSLASGASLMGGSTGVPGGGGGSSLSKSTGTADWQWAR
tara:strand:- start:699 stop:1265 length:567 start_codon:yes stop_codon:yes gene_type:complete